MAGERTASVVNNIRSSSS